LAKGETAGTGLRCGTALDGAAARVRGIGGAARAAARVWVAHVCKERGQRGKRSVALVAVQESVGAESASVVLVFWTETVKLEDRTRVQRPIDVVSVVGGCVA
jgi:hypothetical protein